jgi:putative thioredoxin
MIEANQTNFAAEVIDASHDVPVLVDFWAPWCGPCRALSPVLERVERDAGGRVKVVKVNSDDNPELSAAYAVRSIPCVVAFRAGQPVDRFVGAQPESQVRAFVDRMVPRPGADLRVQAAALLAAGELARAADVLRTGLALNPALEDIRTLYVRTLLRLGRDEDAARAFEPLAAKAGSDLGLAALRLWIEAHAAARELPREPALRQAVQDHPADPAARWQLAQWLLASARWREAMDALLELVRVDRRFGDDAGRRGMLAAFELCEDADLVREYRRRLSAGLF